MTSEERTEKREEIREKSGERSEKRKERRVQREEERKETDRAGPYLERWSFYTAPLHPENKIRIRRGKLSGGLDAKNKQKTKNF